MAYARDNNFDQSLPVFARLHRDHPDDLDVTRYYLAALDWHKETKEAAALYQSLPDSDEPDYVLAPAGDAFRAEGDNDKAIAIYAKAHRLYPRPARFRSRSPPVPSGSPMTGDSNDRASSYTTNHAAAR